MGSHKAAKRCDRGFAAPFFLVTKAHIEMPFSYLLDTFRGGIPGNRASGVWFSETRGARKTKGGPKPKA